jgi:hypothetical protein
MSEKPSEVLTPEVKTPINAQVESLAERNRDLFDEYEQPTLAKRIAEKKKKTRNRLIRVFVAAILISTGALWGANHYGDGWTFGFWYGILAHATYTVLSCDSN